MKDMMNMCKCPECGYEADEMEFKNKPMASKGKINRDGGLSVYLIGEKEGGSSEEENA